VSVSGVEKKNAESLLLEAISSETRLIDAVAAALRVLRSDRDAVIESNTIPNPDLTPDLSTLGEDVKPYVVEYDRVIASCEDALAKAVWR
jgi:hypothetical protein